MNNEKLKELLKKRTQGEWEAVYEDRSGYWIASWDSSGDGGFYESDAKLMALAPKLAKRVLELEEELATKNAECIVSMVKTQALHDTKIKNEKK